MAFQSIGGCKANFFCKNVKCHYFIYSYANKKMFNYYAFTPNLTPENYEYLFFWHRRNKYGYLPSKEEELFSLIIEPSEFFPETSKFWHNQCYKTYKKSGKIIKVKKFGDITLEARLKQK